MNKVVEEFKEAYKNMNKLNVEHSEELYRYYDLYREYIDPSMGDYAIFHHGFKMRNGWLMYGDGYDTIDIPIEFFDNPSQYVKDFEAKCIEEQKQKDIDVELKDKENRRKQFLELRKEFKDEM